MAQELDALGLYYLEEPLPRKDVEGLAEIAAIGDDVVSRVGNFAHRLRFQAAYPGRRV
jgi:L-alanine-DL-glutamate epimerase-like enolase superfamily enzyme